MRLRSRSGSGRVASRRSRRCALRRRGDAAGATRRSWKAASGRLAAGFPSPSAQAWRGPAFDSVAVRGGFLGVAAAVRAVSPFGLQAVAAVLAVVAHELTAAQTVLELLHEHGLTVGTHLGALLREVNHAAGLFE